MSGIPSQGWVILIKRKSSQSRTHGNGKRIRTVGEYQIYHDGVAQTGADMSGVTAESRGPGANKPAGNGKRIKAGTYPLATQDGGKYATIGYADSEVSTKLRRPGIELLETEDRKEILIHPGIGFLASIGCINLCTSLPSSSENITYASSRRRVIAAIEDMKSFLGGDFPTSNGKKIPKAFAVIEGEP